MKEETIREKPNSIELSRNAAGAYSWKIKRYYNEREKTAIKMIDHMNEEMLKRFVI
jgi:hypothetical protein